MNNVSFTGIIHVMGSCNSICNAKKTGRFPKQKEFIKATIPLLSEKESKSQDRQEFAVFYGVDAAVLYEKLFKGDEYPYLPITVPDLFIGKTKMQIENIMLNKDILKPKIREQYEQFLKYYGTCKSVFDNIIHNPNNQAIKEWRVWKSKETDFVGNPIKEVAIDDPTALNALLDALDKEDIKKEIRTYKPKDEWIPISNKYFPAGERGRQTQISP